MADREQQLIEAATSYLQALEGSELVSIPDFIARFDAELREELAAYLELVLAMGDLPAIRLTSDEQAMADRAAARARAHFQQRLAPARTLTQLRTGRMVLGALARQINLPPDLLHRIERGGVDAATIPSLLVTRLAIALGHAETEIRAALAVSPAMPVGVRLNAADGTTVKSEPVVSFAEALTQSAATAAQRDEWR